MSSTVPNVGTYRLTMQAEMPRAPGGTREYLPAGTQVTWVGKPGPHMEPVDPNAHAIVARFEGRIGDIDPVRRLPMQTEAVNPDGSPAEPVEPVFVGPNGQPLKPGVALDRAKAAYAAAQRGEAPPPPPPPPPAPPGADNSDGV